MYLQANHVRVDRVAPHDIFIIFSVSRKKDSCQIALYCYTYSTLGMNFGSMRYYQDLWSSKHREPLIKYNLLLKLFY